MIRFIEIINKTEKNPRLERTAIPQFDMQEVWINEKFVVNLREATGYNKLLREQQLPPIPAVFLKHILLLATSPLLLTD